MGTTDAEQLTRDLRTVADLLVGAGCHLPAHLDAADAARELHRAHLLLRMIVDRVDAMTDAARTMPAPAATATPDTTQGGVGGNILGGYGGDRIASSALFCAENERKTLRSPG